MRIFSIVIALLAGLASLFVSVCGGGFFVTFGYTATRSMLHPASMLHQTAAQVALAILPMLMFAAACAAVGAWAFWRSIRFIRREWLRRD